MKSFDVTAFGQALVLQERPTPAPSGTEVLLKVRATGVCHSDLHMSDGYYDIGGGKKLFVTDRNVKLPVTMGHEVTGEVAALGPDALGVAVGDVRLVFPWIGCGVCPACLRGTENLCRAPNCLGIHRAGGYADYIVVPHAKYLIDIGKLSPEEAAPFACSGLTAYSAVKKLGSLVRTAPVAIIGAGGVGLMAFAIIKAMGGYGGIAVDISDAKLKAATDAGAIATVQSNAPDAIAQIQAAAPDGLLAVIDFVGMPQTAELGIASLARGGVYVAVGLYGGELTYPLPFIPMRALTIQGSYTGSLPELEELMEMARRGDIPPPPIHSDRMSNINAVMGRLREGAYVGRSVVVPDAIAQRQ